MRTVTHGVQLDLGWKFEDFIHSSLAQPCGRKANIWPLSPKSTHFYRLFPFKFFKIYFSNQTINKTVVYFANLSILLIYNYLKKRKKIHIKQRKRLANNWRGINQFQICA